jgi:hypothetical protein
MKLSKQHRVYMAVLGLAGAAWVADRVLFSGGPQQAAAGAVPAAELATAAAEPVTAAAAGPGGGSSVTLGQRLEQLRVSRTAPIAVGDAFEVPSEWRPKVAAARAEAEAPAAPKFDTVKFAREHRLTRVLVGTNLNAAVVDGGSLLRPGQELDGMVLREVTAESAVFEWDGAVVELRMERPDGADGKVGSASENTGPGSGPR